MLIDSLSFSYYCIKISNDLSQSVSALHTSRRRQHVTMFWDEEMPQVSLGIESYDCAISGWLGSAAFGHCGAAETDCAADIATESKTEGLH